MIRRTRIRRGATLVELLVAAAMSIMIMWLLTWCYQQGLASFSNTKAHADLMDQERMVTSVINRDLLADHFLSEDNKFVVVGGKKIPVSGQKVRDQDLTSGSYTPPKYGFFYAYSPGFSVSEGTDADGFQSTRSTNHLLQFTTILPGGPPEQMFNADVPFGTAAPLYGRAAEISYFLVPSGRTLGGTQLYNLIRRQRLCALTVDDKPAYDKLLNQPPAAIQAQFNDASEVMAVIPSGASGQLSTLTLNDLTTPANRLPIASLPVIGNFRLGEDILMSNVVSFEVQFTGPTVTLSPGPPAVIWPSANSDPPYDFLPTANGLTGTFDTNLTSVGGVQSAKIRITGILIKLRAYDPRTRTTRQTRITANL